MVEASEFMPYLHQLPGYGEYVSGGCRGFDATFGVSLARAYPGCPQRIKVPANQSQVDAWWVTPEFSDQLATGSPAPINVDYMPEGTDYRYRNTQLVLASNDIFYWAEFPEDDPRSKRSGTWMTVRIARAMGKHVFGYVQSEEFPCELVG